MHAWIIQKDAFFLLFGSFIYTDVTVDAVVNWITCFATPEVFHSYDLFVCKNDI